jgi:hypothetical protein
MRPLTLFLAVVLLTSCMSNEKTTIENKCYSYPRLTESSLPSGTPDSASPIYFCSIKTLEPFNNSDSIGEYEQRSYSSTLFSFKEPVLYNYYLGEERYRFLWLRSFHLPMVFILSNKNGKVALRIKKLDQTPQFEDEKYGLPWPGVEDDFKGKTLEKIGDSILVVKADRKAKIIFDTTINLRTKDLEKFSSLLAQNAFWTTPVYKQNDAMDGATWIMEAHLENCYRYIIRQSPDKEIREAGEYLIKLSGLQERIY